MKHQVLAYRDTLLVEAITGPCTLEEARQLPAWFWDHRPGLTIRWGDVVLNHPCLPVKISPKPIVFCPSPGALRASNGRHG